MCDVVLARLMSERENGHAHAASSNVFEEK